MLPDSDEVNLSTIELQILSELDRYANKEYTNQTNIYKYEFFYFIFFLIFPTKADNMDF